jgi:hypothetical protein
MISEMGGLEVATALTAHQHPNALLYSKAVLKAGQTA